MRKGFLVLLTLCLLGAAIPVVHADGLDLSGYDDNALLALLGQVQQEIVDRHIKKTAHLPAGTYVGGKDLPVGKYLLASNGSEDDYGALMLGTAADDPDDFPSKLYEYLWSDEQYTFYLTIEDGDILILPYAFTLTISGGVVFQ